MTKPLTIGDLAAATGTKINTIRFYEEIGVMPEPARTGSGRRTYGRRELMRLTFIRHGRALGFSIDELRSLLRVSDHPDCDCAEAAAIARRHLQAVEEQILSLQRVRSELESLATSCEGGKAADCRVIEAIADLGLVSTTRPPEHAGPH